MKHTLSRVAETQPGGRTQDGHREEDRGLKKKNKGCKMETGWGQMAAGIVGANRTPIRG